MPSENDNRPKMKDTLHEPPKPEAERQPGEKARTDNTVEAKDPFGAPRKDQTWSREAITTETVRPSFGGSDDEVTKEQAKKAKQ